VPIDRTHPENERLMRPNPRTVSRELLTRESFLPASTLNLLAASWIQFMIRDWLSHGRSPQEDPWEVHLADEDPWPERPMRILRTPEDPTRTPEEEGTPPTHINVHSHWWDGSQIYGNDEQTQAQVRSGEDGKLRIGPDGLIPVDPNSQKHPADEPGFWIGLVMMHTLFTREHNAICDKLRAEYPSWSDDDLFDHARLINTALLAKIHTIEWTPALLDHPTARRGLNANWWGLAGKTVKKLVGRISESEVISGIVGGRPDHFGVPFSLTEEFVSVYRMHPLIPDDYTAGHGTDGPGRDAGPVLHLRCRPPRRDHPAQLPTRPPEFREAGAGSNTPRPRGYRHIPQSGARRATLQRVPQAAPPQAH
jgi:hypothetical protein